MSSSSAFLFNRSATTVIYTLSLHDALPIFGVLLLGHDRRARAPGVGQLHEAELAARPQDELGAEPGEDRKSTRLNSSHPSISYAGFCLKKKTDVAGTDRAVHRHVLLPLQRC